MSEQENVQWHGTLASYLVGFLASVALTLTAYYLVVQHTLGRSGTIGAIVGLGLLQAAIQLLLFLHLGKESRPRWNLLFFFFMILVVSIVVLGSLWIMHSLGDRVMATKRIPGEALHL